MHRAKYGHYELHATDTGYCVSWVGGSMSINVEEEGGHGPVEELYAMVDQKFHEFKKVAERHQEEVARITGKEG
jgi:hypothetical protein